MKDRAGKDPDRKGGVGAFREMLDALAQGYSVALTADVPKVSRIVGLGIVMLASPLETIEILTLIVAIWLIVIGAFEIVSAFGIRSASRRIEKALVAGSPNAT